MKKISNIILIICFNFTIISCAKKDDSTDTKILPGRVNLETFESHHRNIVTLESDHYFLNPKQNRTEINLDNFKFYDEILLVKYDSTGTIAWKEKFHSDNESGISMTVDSFENIYVAGYVKAGIYGSLNSGKFKIFLKKYNSSGIMQWTKHLGESPKNYGIGITVDSLNNIYLTGFINIVREDEKNIESEKFFLMKYDPYGRNQWTKKLGLSKSEFVLDVTVDSSDNILVTGFDNNNFENKFNLLSENFFYINYNSEGILQ